MKKRAVAVGPDLSEQVRYRENSLPFSFCEDHFEQFINHEVNYHWHDELEFSVILKGDVEYTIYQPNGRQASCLLHEGDGVFINTKRLHTARQRTPDSVMSCFLFPNRIFAHPLIGDLYTGCVQPILRHPFPGMFFSCAQADGKEIADTIRQFLDIRTDVPGYELHYLETLCRLWRLLLTQFLAREKPVMTQKENRREERVRLMLAYIHAHYAENITVSDIACSASISKSECFRCFREIIQKSPVDYLLEYRLSKATTLLTGTNRTVLDISLCCGFQSESYFCKLFREKCGVSPGEFRRRAQSQHIAHPL